MCEPRSGVSRLSDRRKVPGALGGLARCLVAMACCTRTCMNPPSLNTTSFPQKPHVTARYKYYLMFTETSKRGGHAINSLRVTLKGGPTRRDDILFMGDEHGGPRRKKGTYSLKYGRHERAGLRHHRWSFSTSSYAGLAYKFPRRFEFPLTSRSRPSRQQHDVLVTESAGRLVAAYVFSRSESLWMWRAWHRNEPQSVGFMLSALYLRAR